MKKTRNILIAFFGAAGLTVVICIIIAAAYLGPREFIEQVKDGRIFQITNQENLDETVIPDINLTLPTLPKDNKTADTTTVNQDSSNSERSNKICKTCQGSGFKTCPKCKGNGSFVCPKCNGKKTVLYQNKPITCSVCYGGGLSTCDECMGKGRNKECETCGGKGYAF